MTVTVAMRNHVLSSALQLLRAGRIGDAEDELAAAPEHDLTIDEVFAVYRAEQEAESEQLLDGHRRAERTLDWLTALFRDLPVAALILDANGDIVDANRRALAELGLEQALRVQHVPLRRLFVREEDERRLMAALQRVLREKTSASFAELPLRSPSGEPRWADVSLSHAPPSAHVGTAASVLCVLVDATGRLEAQHSREDARQSELARERAEAASQAKSSLLSRISHELRTPLNAVIGFSHLMLADGRGRELGEKSVHRLKLIHEAGQSLLTLVDEVLEFNAADSGRLSVHCGPLSLPAMVASVMPLHQPAIDATCLSVAVAAPASNDAPMALGDERHVREILNNLIGNAVKYNRRGGSVRIAFGHDAQRARVDVSDDGPGLAPDQMVHLFEPFNRLGADRTGIPGHGLGLSIAKALAQAMNGTIEARSMLGRGATFTLWLPLAANS